MTISPTLGVIIIMNNYFHDVATTLLAASGVAPWVIIRRYEQGAERPTAGYFLRVYAGVTRLARSSRYWILIGGIPRTFFTGASSGPMQWTTRRCTH